MTENVPSLPPTAPNKALPTPLRSPPDSMLGPVRDAGVGSSLRGRRAGKHALLPGPRPLPSPWKRSGHGGRDGGSVWVAGRFCGAGMRRVAQAEVSSPCHLFRRSQPGAHSERNGLGDNARMSCRPESRCGAVDDRPAANPCGPPIDTRSAQGARWERNAYYPTRHVSLPATACVSGPATQQGCHSRLGMGYEWKQ